MTLSSLLLSDVRDTTKDRLEATFLFGGVGNDGTTPTSADTTLGNEQFRDTIDDFDKSVTNAVTASIRVLTTENNGNAIREVAFFNAASAGTMWTRDAITAINKTSDIQVFLDLTTTLLVTEGT